MDPFCDGLPVESAKTLAADGHSLFGKRLRPELDRECPGKKDSEPAKRRMGIMLKILSTKSEPNLGKHFGGFPAPGHSKLDVSTPKTKDSDSAV